MLDRLTGKSVHLYIHLFCCCFIAAGLPASKIPLSLGTILIALNLLLQADFRTYGKRLREIKAGWPLWAYLIINLLSLFWSTDMNYAAKDLGIKLPLFIIPIVLVCNPVTSFTHRKLIVGLFIASLFVTSLLNVGTYQHWWGNKVYDDFRGLSLFSSHIRYALMIAMGFAFCLAWIFLKIQHRWVAVLLAIWFAWYTNYSQILSGYLALSGVMVVLFFRLIDLIRSRKVKIAFLLFIGIGVITAAVALINIMTPVPHKVTLENLPRYTVNGNLYRHTTKTQTWENGYPVVAYINDTELAKGWNAASKIDYATGVEAKNRPVYYTLWLYMTSKGLHKDSAGFTKMTRKDVKFVERGYTSFLHTDPGLKARLYEIKDELEHPEDPNGHTLLQRIEYWKAGASIARENWLFGVGAGDVDKEFQAYYKRTNSLLQPDLQHRAHNQFLTSWLTGGILCLITFILWWFNFLGKMWKEKSFAATCFAVIAILSFLVEDTLETQVGLTFAAFFYGLFVTSESLDLYKG